MIDEFRSGLLPSDEAVAGTLADHLRDRFTILVDGLEFIVDNSNVKDKEEALRDSQYYAEMERTVNPP